MVLPVAVPKHAAHSMLQSTGSQQMPTVVGSPTNPVGYSGQNGSGSMKCHSVASGNINGTSAGSFRSSLSRSSSTKSRGGSFKWNMSGGRGEYGSRVTESFVKIEGFRYNGKESCESNKNDNEASGKIQRDPSGNSLLTRELSLENLHIKEKRISSSWSAASTAGSSPMYSNNSQSTAFSLQLPTLEPSPAPGLRNTPILSMSPSSVPESMLVELQKKHSVFNEPLVARAFNIARLAHDGQVNVGARPGPTFEKCVAASLILADLGADEAAVSSALLHDCLDESMLDETQLRSMLGSERTVKVVKSVSHLTYLSQRFEETMPMAMTLCAPHETSQECLDLIALMLAHASPRSLLVRLGVALAEMKICASAVKQSDTMVHDPYVRKVAHEAMNIWAPLANRLGVWSIKSQLEDLSFSCLLPEEHTSLQQRLSKAQEPTALVGLMDSLRGALQKNDVEYLDLSGRPKHLWGVWCKMQKKGYSAERVQDVRGLRVIVHSREDCYKTLRAVEKSWKVVGSSKNYIKDPKKNGYQSLHVIADPGDGHLVEIQIRTDKMHYLAEYGADASHWKYKELAFEDKDSSPCDVAKEANWAKFITQKHVSMDKKYRPSGSPSEDKSLEMIMAGLHEKRNSEKEEKDGKKGRSFQEYIEESGQAVAPPGDRRVMVAVIAAGVFKVEALPHGTTIGQVLDSHASMRASTPGSTRKVTVNRREDQDAATLVRTGDVLEIHTEPYVAPIFVQSNSLPLGGLAQKLKQSPMP